MKAEVEAIAVFKADLEDEGKRTVKEAEAKVLRLKLENETMRMTIKKMAVIKMIPMPMTMIWSLWEMIQ